MHVNDLIPRHIMLDKVDCWFQNEARIDQQNITTRLWAQKGNRPRAVKQQQFEYDNIFGRPVQLMDKRGRF